MQILELADEATLGSAQRDIDRMLAAKGVVKKYVAPASMSFLTSLRIATALKTFAAETVVVHTSGDLNATRSARCLLDKDRRGLGVVYHARHDDPGRSIVRSVMGEANVWVFDCEDTRSRFASMRDMYMKRTALLHPTTTGAPAPAATTDILTLVWFGTVAYPLLLKGVIEWLTTHDDVQLRVCGTSRAREVMPLVKLARDNNINVEWLGEDYDLESELAGAHAAIASAPAPGDEELRMMAGGKPVLDAARLDEWYANRREIEEQTRSTWNTLHSPQIYTDTYMTLMRP